MEDKNLEEITFSEKPTLEEEDEQSLRKSPSTNLLRKRINILFLAFLALLLGCIIATIFIFTTFALVLDSQTRIMYLQKQIDELFSIVKK